MITFVTHGRSVVQNGNGQQINFFGASLRQPVETKREVTITINGRAVPLPEEIKTLLIETKGAVNMEVDLKANHFDSVKTAASALRINGDVTHANTSSGSIHCNDVLGNANSMSGDVNCRDVRGLAHSMSGNVNVRGTAGSAQRRTPGVRVVPGPTIIRNRVIIEDLSASSIPRPSPEALLRETRALITGSETRRAADQQITAASAGPSSNPLVNLAQTAMSIPIRVKRERSQIPVATTQEVIAHNAALREKAKKEPLQKKSKQK